MHTFANVLILGAGPAALIAAHTAVMANAGVTIKSNLAAKSDLHGCQYLHGPAPYIQNSLAGETVKYTRNGSGDDYRVKVYGDNWQGNVSAEDLLGEHLAWDIRSAYDMLWDWYQPMIKPQAVSATVLSHWLHDNYLSRYTHIFSTIPLDKICCTPGPHDFRSQWIWAMGRPATEENWGDDLIPEFTVACDGTNNDAGWYRTANVFGHQTREWPSWYGSNNKLPSGAVQVSKPLSSRCDCWPEITRIGRYGRWDKAQLVHHVPAQVREALGV